jgi:hypothetical protein
MAQNPAGEYEADAPYVDQDGDQHFNGTSLYFEQAWLRLGAPTVSTIATGVLTVTGSFIACAAESSTSDTVDSIVVSGTDVADGDLLILIADVGDTITFDDAVINLGAATRAVAPGGCLILRYDGAETQWTEVVFLAGADNA